VSLRDVDARGTPTEVWAAILEDRVLNTIQEIRGRATRRAGAKRSQRKRTCRVRDKKRTRGGKE